ncbi:MAG: DegT/DnrJ/EryC1/StrS aminotransferase family protein [Leptospiraceae bacterium]|nr:DegT/DnrJ/EryC1/StrS aminotransferase family protein [Leptospiraceae bacterium]MDW8307574.1 DegT/DnrJ/EryC1/StrS aminotransferase family protein [Leptospiraceae bacterium]
MAIPYTTGGSKKVAPIPFSKPTLTKNEIKSVLETLIQDGISSGATLQNYEREIARALEFERALALPSLFAAYHLAFLSLNLKEGDEVILPATAPVAALDALGQLGVRAVLCDVSRHSFHPSIKEIEPLLTPCTKAILFFYAFGSYFPYRELKEEVASRLKAKVYFLEDITYLAGSEADGQFVGADADIAIIGLHEDGLMTIGRGAVLLMDSTALYSVARDLRMHGGSKTYRVRYDYTITDYQAAMGLEQLSLLPQILERRRRIAEIFLENLASSVLTTHFHNLRCDGFGLFPVFFECAVDQAQRYFQSLAIETRRVFPLGPLHHLLGLPPSSFPNTERLYQRGLLLPLYPYLTKVQVEQIASAIRQFPR